MVLHHRSILITLVLGALSLGGAPAFAQESDGRANASSVDTATDIAKDLSVSADQKNLFEKRYNIAAERYLAKWGNLPNIKLVSGRILRIGASGPAVAALRKRLGVASGNQFDESLGQRIRQYRLAHGLTVASHADATLIESLNNGPEHYLKLVRNNVDRLASLPIFMGQRFVLVDIANQVLHMYEADERVGSMRVVVGKPSDQTPLIHGVLTHSVVNPYWNIPPDLTEKRFAPRAIRQGKSYLNTRRFEALSSWTDSARVLSFNEVNWQAVAAGTLKLRMRQRPGPGNGMGDIKIMFPNRHGIYLHDTANKALFSKEQRAFSAGCIRLEKPWQLAQWLHGNKPGKVGDRPEQRINISNPVPVYITYMTAIPNAHGFSFADDIYGLDKRPQKSEIAAVNF